MQTHDEGETWPVIEAESQRCAAEIALAEQLPWLLWQQHPDGTLTRLNEYPTLADAVSDLCIYRAQNPQARYWVEPPQHPDVQLRQHAALVEAARAVVRYVLHPDTCNISPRLETMVRRLEATLRAEGGTPGEESTPCPQP